MCDGEKLLSPSFHNFPILIFFSPPTSSFSPLRRAPKPTPSPSPAIVSVFSSPLALALHRRRAAVGLFFPLRRSLFICLLSTSDHPPRLHLLLSPPSLTPASFSSLSRHFSLFAGLTILPSSSEPPQPSTSASPPSLLCSSPPMHQIPPPWSLLFHFYTHDPRGFSFADDHGCCLSSFFLLSVSLCFLTTSTATCLFFSDLRPRDLGPFAISSPPPSSSDPSPSTSSASLTSSRSATASVSFSDCFFAGASSPAVDRLHFSSSGVATTMPTP